MMNVTEALHCLGCGAELGLMPLAASPGMVAGCPRCRVQPLDAFSNEGGTVLDCAKCGGQFVSPDVLGVMVARHQTCSFDLPQRRQRNNPFESRVTYLPCPFCTELMLRRNFGKTSGIVVDVCSKHGTWFDAGELPRILAFVSRGGLAWAREAEEAEKKRLAAGTESVSKADLSLVWGIGCREPSPTVTLSDMEEATLAFVRWVKEMLR